VIRAGLAAMVGDLPGTSVSGDSKAAPLFQGVTLDIGWTHANAT
jgi:hypothetical protein